MEDAAATRIQAVVRGLLARIRLISVVNRIYERAYDDGSGHFFYFNKVTGESSCEPPGRPTAARAVAGRLRQRPHLDG